MALFRAVLIFMAAGTLCLAQDSPSSNLPETPQPQMLLQPAPPPEISQRARPTVWNKKFIAAHAAYLGAIVYDIEVTHQGLAHHKCLEKTGGDPSPSRGELYGKDLPVYAASAGLDWVLAKYKIPYMPYVLPVAGTVVHVQGGTKWFTEGCY
jgi:hypothetical protein